MSEKTATLSSCAAAVEADRNSNRQALQVALGSAGMAARNLLAVCRFGGRRVHVRRPRDCQWVHAVPTQPNSCAHAKRTWLRCARRVCTCISGDVQS